jgi:uncharacterized protein YeaO (DUF488 family)
MSRPRRERGLRLATKSVHTPPSPSDGLRILVARWRGRGLPSSVYDVWMANLGPSEKLLRQMLAGKISWPDYSKRYRDELFAPAAADSDNVQIKNHGQKFTLRLIKQLASQQPVTLLCHCAEDEQHCHRHLLRRLIERS